MSFLLSCLNEILETSFLTLSPSLTTADAVVEMAKAITSFALVLQEDKPCGIITERDIVRLISSRQDLNTLTLSETMTRNLIVVRECEINDIFQASQLFSRYRVRHLPITDRHNRVLGVMTPQSVQSLMKPEYLLRSICVEEAMVSTVIQSSKDEFVFQLAQKMTGHKVSCVVIVDPSTNCPLGIITERDIAQFHALALNLWETTAEDVMSTPLKTVQPSDSLWVVQELMQEMRVRRLAVVRSTGELAGIVTQTQILKLLNPAEMYKVVEQMKRTIEQQTQKLNELNRALKIANNDLQRKASFDSLTEIPNRRQFDERLPEIWESLSQARAELTLILCDVDYFKAYNDLYGHVQGDECLATIAKALSQTVRSSTDLVARYGGEEFAILLPNCGVSGAEKALQTMLRQFQSLKIPHSGSTIADYVTISLGAAVVGLPSKRSQTDLIDLADKMLYKSKQQGRNQFSLETLS